LEREIRQRERLYPGWVENGLANPPRRPAIKLETAETKLRALRAAALSLRFLAENREWITDVWRQRKSIEDRDRDEVPDVPAAARTTFDVVQKEFPGAQVVEVRPTEHVR